jgi:hypothetical protein
MDTRNAGAQLVGGVLQNRADKQQFDQEFGPNSMYAKLLASQQKAIEDEAKARKSTVKVAESLIIKK